MRDDCKKRLHDDRISWGLCILCGKPLKGANTKMCPACIKRRTEYSAANREHIREVGRDRRRRYREAGLCVFCGKPVYDGHSTCEYHYDYYKSLRKKVKRHGNE